MSAALHREPVYVILRADLFLGRESEPETMVTAKAVVQSQDFASAEVSRLNAMHPDGSVRYWWQASRLVTLEGQ